MILKSKDDLIHDFQSQLKKKDEEYIHTLKKQAEDIETMMSTIRTEYVDLQSEYENELSLIEVEKEKISIYYNYFVLYYSL